jgi:hypothetical protein
MVMPNTGDYLVRLKTNGDVYARGLEMAADVDEDLVDITKRTIVKGFVSQRSLEEKSLATLKLHPEADPDFVERYTAYMARKQAQGGWATTFGLGFRTMVTSDVLATWGSDALGFMWNAMKTLPDDVVSSTFGELMVLTSQPLATATDGLVKEGVGAMVNRISIMWDKMIQNGMITAPM